MENKETKIQSVTETTKTEKIRRKLTKTAAKIVFAVMAAMSVIPTAFAEGETNETKGTSPGNFASNMLSYAWWIMYGICGIFAAMGVIKMIQGQAEEDTRARNNGISTLVIAAAGILIVALIQAQVK